MDINGRTRIAGIFGYPVEHTLSPIMHNAAFSHLAMDCRYLPFSVAPSFLRQAVDAVRALSFIGVNITIPHKETVIPFLDHVDAEAGIIGAVNTVVNRQGVLAGYNTDGKGFMRSLDEIGVAVAGMKVLIIGSGGSSRAVGYYLGRESGSLSVYNRTREKAVSLASQLSLENKVNIAERLDRLSGYDIIINATPVGLNDSDPAPFDTDLLDPNQIVCDLIYRNTPLIRQSRARGCRTVDGSGMLLWQGVLAFELWTGIVPPVEIMRSALLNVNT